MSHPSAQPPAPAAARAEPSAEPPAPPPAPPFAPPSAAAPQLLPRAPAVRVFLAFAFAYFLSSLLRGIAATMAPALLADFALSASDLGLLAGGYFLGFSAVQLPLGAWLDAHGPRRVVLGLLGVAVLGCALFALARGFAGLMLARVLMGVGVGACLMAALTGYRRWFDARLQLRANAWMLMTGSLGMLASTLPVQWLLPMIGWRWLFALVAAALALGMAALALAVPAWHGAGSAASARRWPVASKKMAPCAMQARAGGALDAAPAMPDGCAMPAAPARCADAAASASASASASVAPRGYAAIVRHPYFRCAVPLAMVCHGGMLAVQTLWAGPWLRQVARLGDAAAAGGLFAVNLAMLLAFWGWGLLLPRLAARGAITPRVVGWVARIMPLAYAALAVLVAAGAALGPWAPLALLLYCVLSTPASHVQATVGLAFDAALAGRALSAFNLAIFSGVFVLQWGIGLAVDALVALGWQPADALRGAVGAFGLCSLACWRRFVRQARALHAKPRAGAQAE